MDISEYLDEELDEFLDELSIENISIALPEPIIKWLDKKNEEKDKNKRNLQYVLDGIYISRIKVLKYFGTILKNKYTDKKEAILYSMCKNSYLTKEEFDKLKNLIDESEAF